MTHPTSTRPLLGAALALATLAAVPAQAGVLSVFEANATSAADLQSTVDDFRTALGPLNAPAPVSGDPAGRREINWDGAPDSVSDPNAFPGDFFNQGFAPLARGIEFKEAGATTGFELSSTAASGETIEFGFPGGFTFFSPERLFTPIGDTLFDVFFFDPVDQVTTALTRGLGVVFTDVENTGSASMSFYDIDDTLLYTRDVLAGANASLSFLGVIFDDAEVARVRIDAGIVGFDSIVMDDFIYGEPIAVADVPLPLPAALLGAGLLGLGTLRRRKRG
ncbi:hypothetical protein [Pseudooceanicola sp. LIPI14-2-Ac024]|uniref:hypothetical protein n=1 Tax=Pseudooceanicola sp. LIPI14-2-Ac024 TaxID=3344875 RepID=UPI0035CF0547